MSVFIDDASEIVDVAGVFSRTLEAKPGLSAAKAAAVPPLHPLTEKAVAATADRMRDLLAALRSVQSGGGQVPFTQFCQWLPGTPLDAVGTAAEIAKKGWVDIKVDDSSVRLTDLGRTVVNNLPGTLR